MNMLKKISIIAPASMLLFPASSFAKSAPANPSFGIIHDHPLLTFPKLYPPYVPQIFIVGSSGIA